MTGKKIMNSCGFMHMCVTKLWIEQVKMRGRDGKSIFRIMGDAIENGRHQKQVLNWGNEEEDTRQEFDRMMKWLESESTEPYICNFSIPAKRV